MKVGEFTYENGTVSGPAQYMTEKGNAKVEDILAGRSAVFNYGVGLPGANPAQLVLVALQTDYAGWRGMRLTKAELG